MIASTSQKPETRRKQIESAIERTLKYDQNEYLRSFGLEIGNQLMEVDGRVLPSPDVIFHRDQIIRGTEGAWNLRGVKVSNQIDVACGCT
jgi:eukaryotic translation initiation factor 2C